MAQPTRAACRPEPILALAPVPLLAGPHWTFAHGYAKLCCYGLRRGALPVVPAAAAPPHGLAPNTLRSGSEPSPLATKRTLWSSASSKRHILSLSQRG